jgi:hypothetical protein
MTNSEEVLDLIKQRVGAYKTRGNETVFQECPFCGNARANFELNMVKGVFHCWVCGESGGVRWLLQKLGIKYSGELPAYRKPVEKKPEAAGELKLPEGVVAIGQGDEFTKLTEYLDSRGITKEDIKTYEILWWKAAGRVLFPFRNSAGNLIFWTARTIYKHIRPKYLHATVSKANRIITYYGHGEDDSVFIVEGVFDGLCLNKMGKTVIILMGSEISDTLKEYLRASKKDVVLVLDQDVAAKQMGYQMELGALLGKDRVKAFYIVGKDVAEVGLVGGEGFGGFVRSRLKKGGMDNGLRQDKGSRAL